MKLSELERDERAIEDGMWVQPDPAKDIEFLARGETPRFRSRFNAAVRQLVQAFGSLDAEKAQHPKAKKLGQILFEECILDVRNIFHDDERSRPVSLAELRAHACTPRGEPAYNLALAAVDRVTARRRSDAEDAEGNSSGSGNGSGDGGATPTSSPSSRRTTPTP